MTTSSSVEQRLEQLQRIDRFEPHAEFRKQAIVTDPFVYDTANADPLEFWAEQARALAWSKPFTKVLGDANAPFYTWFEDGELNVSYNCLDRHVEAGLGGRIAFHWHGEEGEERLITYVSLLGEVQRRERPTDQTFLVGVLNQTRGVLADLEGGSRK
jgi:acetyl-CoA synthetase